MSPAANSWRLSSVERASMTDQVQRELREAIIEGRIPQGEALREVSLATTLGTGRSAVREAIRQLVQEGLVEYEPHRGAYVRVMSLADRLDVYAAREAIESGAVRRILAGPPVDLSELRAALEVLRATTRFDDHVTDDVIAADIRFHEELVRLAGSPRLQRAHETLVAETRMLLRHHPVYPWATYISDHAQVVEALERRDAGAPELIAEHLRLSARLIAGELEDEAAGEPPVARDAGRSSEERGTT